MMAFLGPVGALGGLGLASRLFKNNKDKNKSQAAPSLTTEGYSSSARPSMISKPQIY